MEALNKEIAKNKPYDIVQTSSTKWKKKKVWGLLKLKFIILMENRLPK